MVRLFIKWIKNGCDMCLIKIKIEINIFYLLI